ncbi:MAG TPA: dipeptide epimerase [Nitrospiraceae bacterium]|nr:dipeptide epimerase [Nitrospiraceae bacterium]
MRWTITQITFWPVDIPITDPFVVATGTRTTAQNVFVRVSLASGAEGYGEAAPFPEVGGETRSSSLTSLVALGEVLLGRSVLQFAHLSRVLAERAASEQPAARCALETAMLDALCREAEVPMWALWGGADVRERECDITIPIVDRAKTVELARGWYAKGFRLFKMKIGKDVDADIGRLEAVHRACTGIAFIGDGNQGFTREECLAFVEGVKRFGGKLVLLEQPLVREDLDGLSAIRHLTGIPVAADESVRSLHDARLVIEKEAADYVNIKIMKTGVIQALEIASFARSAGLRLMVGGMVETRIAMGCSFGLVLGLGGFDVLDLDTPLLLAEDPVEGGYRYRGPFLLPWDDAGLDVRSRPSSDSTVLK